MEVFGLLVTQILQTFSAGSTNLNLSGNAGGYLALYNQSGINQWAIDPIGQVSLLNDGSAAWFLDQNGSTTIVKKVSTNGIVLPLVHPLLDRM